MTKTIGSPEHYDYAADRIQVAANGCWHWTGTVYAHGYGDVKTSGGVRTNAHRFVYALHNGPIPAGLELDHLCHTNDPTCDGRGNTCLHRRCVNPDHLEPVTRRTNALRSDSQMAKQARQTHCVHGHEFSPENTYLIVTPNRRRRRCKACHAAQVAKSRAARKAA